jgi:acyl carrier protein
MNRVEQQILTHIQTELVSGLKGEFTPDTDLAGIVDSTAIMELVVWIEGTFGFAVELDDIHPDNFGSVARLGRWICKNTGDGAA